MDVVIDPPDQHYHDNSVYMDVLSELMRFTIAALLDDVNGARAGSAAVVVLVPVGDSSSH